MSLLTGLQLARMRRTADHSLTQFGEVWRPTDTPDGKGGQTSVYAAVSKGPWRVAPIVTIAEAEAVFAGRLGGVKGWWATAQYFVEVRLADQIRLGGRVFEVVSFDTGRAFHVSLRVLCKEVT